MLRSGAARSPQVVVAGRSAPQVAAPLVSCSTLKKASPAGLLDGSVHQWMHQTPAWPPSAEAERQASPAADSLGGSAPSSARQGLRQASPPMASAQQALTSQSLVPPSRSASLLPSPLASLLALARLLQLAPSPQASSLLVLGLASWRPALGLASSQPAR